MADRISQEVIEVGIDNVANSRISQEVLEAMICQPTPANTNISQIVLEIIICPLPPVLLCPVGSAATIGVPYTGMLIASGGAPPYTFSIIS